MFAQRNPKSSRGDLTEVGKLVAEFRATVANLSPVARKRLIARKERFKKLIVEIASESEAAPNPLKLVAKATPWRLGRSGARQSSGSGAQAEPSGL